MLSFFLTDPTTHKTNQTSFTRLYCRFITASHWPSRTQNCSSIVRQMICRKESNATTLMLRSFTWVPQQAIACRVHTFTMHLI